MKQKQFGKEKNDGSPVDQGDTERPAKPNSKALDPAIILPKKKSGNKPSMSPILQVMKAVTATAINPPKKKAPKIPGGPSKANHSKPAQRIDKSDGPSAEKKGKA